MVNLGRKLLILFVIFLLFFPKSILASDFIDCDMEKVRQDFKKFFLSSDREKKDVDETVVLHETRKIKLGDLEFCEIVYSIENPNINPEFKDMKFVAYVRNNIFISGDVRVSEEGGVKYVSQEKFTEINRKFFEKVHQREIDIRNKLKERFSTITELEKLSDISLGSALENVRYNVYIFIDPRCPYSTKIISYFEEKLAERSDLKVNYILTPVLGEESKKMSTSVLCDFVDHKERIRKLKEHYVSKNICKEGQDKVNINFTFFSELNFPGVPVGVIFKKNVENEFEFLDIIIGANFYLYKKIME